MALHVSSGSSAHHQEHKTVHTASGIVRPLLLLSCMRWNQIQTNFTFICPCIASIPLKYNQQDATFFRYIYFYKWLYMFQAVPSPIIRSTKRYIQLQVLPNKYCCLLLPWTRWNSTHTFLSIILLSTILTCICLIAGCLSGEKSRDSVTRSDVTA